MESCETYAESLERIDRETEAARYAFEEAQEEARNCPRCEVPLKHVREKYGDDADGNRGVWIDYFYCRKCDWKPGDATSLCAHCGKWNDDLQDHEGDMVCESCGEIAKAEATFDYAAQLEQDITQECEGVDATEVVKILRETREIVGDASERITVLYGEIGKLRKAMYYALPHLHSHGLFAAEKVLREALGEEAST